MGGGTKLSERFTELAEKQQTNNRNNDASCPLRKNRAVDLDNETEFTKITA